MLTGGEKDTQGVPEGGFSLSYQSLQGLGSSAERQPKTDRKKVSTQEKKEVVPASQVERISPRSDSRRPKVRKVNKKQRRPSSGRLYLAHMGPHRFKRLRRQTGFHPITRGEGRAVKSKLHLLRQQS